MEWRHKRFYVSPKRRAKQAEYDAIMLRAQELAAAGKICR
jgi:hypothetical protein